MRRTLLLVLALPALLVGVGPKAGGGSDAEPAAVVRPAVLAAPGDTSDGAAPAAAAPARDRVGSAEFGADRTPEVTLREGSTGADGQARVARTSREGFLVARGGLVSGAGPRWRYTVEVEPATGLDLDVVAAKVVEALHDDRSWTATRTLEQVEDPDTARIRLLIATPETVDRLCAEVGLRTVGIFSCWNGRFAALNAWRWDAGAAGFDDLDTYRTYLVNHEFGHGLGYGHIGCPAAGSRAPVMMQQSKGLGGCAANGWPYP